jgi:hypothetical protein
MRRAEMSKYFKARVVEQKNMAKTNEKGCGFRGRYQCLHVSKGIWDVIFGLCGKRGEEEKRCETWLL